MPTRSGGAACQGAAGLVLLAALLGSARDSCFVPDAVVRNW